MYLVKKPGQKMDPMRVNPRHLRDGGSQEVCVRFDQIAIPEDPKGTCRCCVARPEGTEHTQPTIVIEGVDALVDCLSAA
jgi:hypothetical protein